MIHTRSEAPQPQSLFNHKSSNLRPLLLRAALHERLDQALAHEAKAASDDATLRHLKKRRGGAECCRCLQTYMYTDTVAHTFVMHIHYICDHKLVDTCTHLHKSS